MQALLFEMEPRAGHEDHYFRHAATLRPILDKHEGLLFIDRFKSLSRPQVILSHSHWRDEASIARWRTNRTHHKSQAAGRNEHFKDYRIRISHVLHFGAKDGAAQDWTAAGAYTDPGSSGARRLVTVASSGAPWPGAGDGFASVNFTDKFLGVTEVESEAEGRALVAEAAGTEGVETTMLSLVSRDYGMFDRAQAPQYFADAPAR